MTTPTVRRSRWARRGKVAVVLGTLGCVGLLVRVIEAAKRALGL